MDGAELSAWIIEAGLRGTPETDVVGTLCERLVEAGVPITRVRCGSDVLDPTVDARGVHWDRGEPARLEDFMRDALDEEEWRRSPFYRIAVLGEDEVRRRLAGPGYVVGEFPVLDELKARGATDYFLSGTTWLGERFGEMRGLVVSFTTDAPEGFSDAHLATLRTLMPALGLFMRLSVTQRAARTLLETYVGRDAATRVLAGNIVRGKAETIRAVVWYSDLVGFTRIADRLDHSGVLGLLNDYAEVQVEAIEDHGGHVLKFMGDGILAIFPGEIAEAACLQALDAAEAMREAMAALNLRRSEAAQPVTDTHLALHVGELLYGNFGGPRRLDFTVLGPAVNEAARIEALCGSLEQSVIVSTAFAEAAGPRGHNRLVSLGRYAMKGVARPQELFTLDPG